MINVSKKILALIMSMLMVFSCMAVSASATGEEGTETTAVVIQIPAPVCTLDKELKTITVSKPANIHYTENDTYYEVAISIAPEEGVVKGFDENGNYLYSQLTLGTDYVITATLIDETNTVTGSASKTVELLESQDAPAAPVPVAITSDSITVTAAAGCQYILRTVDGTVVFDWTDSAGKDAIMYEGLTEKTQYVVAAKKKATETHYESAEASITVTTKAAGKGKAAAPVLEDKTNASITVVAENGVEYSLDGKTWQASNEFTGLKADTQYEIYARYTFDSKLEDPSEASDALVVKTNAAANYEANKKNIAFAAEKGQYANSEVKFTVSGDGPADMNNVVYGDTRIIPVSYTVVFGSTEIKASTAWDTAKVTNTGSFTAADYAEKVVTVKVTFVSEEYKGKAADGTAIWENTGSFTESYDVELGRTNSTQTKILEFFETILNFLLNTIPAFFAEALKSDVWARLLEALGELGKVMG